MSEVANTKASPVVGVIRGDKMQAMFEERLGRRAGQFTTSLISVVNNNKNIAECEPMTVIRAALEAASMDLPINQNLGFAYIVPYNNNKNIDGEWIKVKEAQFQMGYKGFIQLAQRSGQFKTIDTCMVYEGDTDESVTQRLTSIIAPNPPSNTVIGYVAYFELLNGFSKSLHMTKEDVEKHAMRYSQAYKGSKISSNRSSHQTPWQTDFDLMAQKTALKLLLSRFAPLSTEMQRAIEVDQSVVGENGVSYADRSDDIIEGERADEDGKSAILAANGVQGDDEQQSLVDVPPAENEDKEVQGKRATASKKK